MGVLFKLSVTYGSVIYAECHIKAPNAECRYAECHYAECRVAIKTNET